MFGGNGPSEALIFLVLAIDCSRRTISGHGSSVVRCRMRLRAIFRDGPAGSVRTDTGKLPLKFQRCDNRLWAVWHANSVFIVWTAGAVVAVSYRAVRATFSCRGAYRCRGPQFSSEVRLLPLDGISSQSAAEANGAVVALAAQSPAAF